MQTELTTRNKKNLLRLDLLTGRLTKEKIMSKYDIDERTARDWVSEIGKEAPIPSTSDKSGYYIATHEEHLDDIEHSIKDFESRQRKLEERLIPLYRKRDELKYDIGHKKTGFEFLLKLSKEELDVLLLNATERQRENIRKELFKGYHKTYQKET